MSMVHHVEGDVGGIGAVRKIADLVDPNTDGWTERASVSVSLQNGSRH